MVRCVFDMSKAVFGYQLVSFKFAKIKSLYKNLEV